jgi:hypothetical protein
MLPPGYLDMTAVVFSISIRKRKKVYIDFFLKKKKISSPFIIHLYNEEEEEKRFLLFSIHLSLFWVGGSV